MSSERGSGGTTTAVPGGGAARGGLRAAAVGLRSVLLMAVGNAAPITAMSFNVPIAVGFGNGLGAPAGFLFATVVAPGLGGLGMLYALYRLWTNRAFAAGYGSDSRILQLLPAYVVLTLAAGFGYALWLRRAHPAAYLQVGRTTVEEAHERG